MAMIIDPDVWEKLVKKHRIDPPWEIIQCFANRFGIELDDIREEHKTNPKTVWFISETDCGRKLKVVFMRYPNGDIKIKSVFPPDAKEMAIYTKHGYQQPNHLTT